MVNHFIISPTNIKENLSEEEGREYDEQIEELKHSRGNFIEILIEIENKIDAIIVKLLTKPEKVIESIFREKVLNSRILNLRSKMNLLCSLLKLNNESEEYNELKNSLEFLVAERNKWAHGLIFFERKKVDGKIILQPNLLFYNSKDEQSSIKLSQKYVRDVNERLALVNTILNRQIEELGLETSLPEGD